MSRSGRTDPTKCRSLRHDWTPQNRTHGGTGACRLCHNLRDRARYVRRPRAAYGPQGPTRDMLEDIAFLFETGLQPIAIAAKLDLNYQSMLRVMRRHGGPLAYNRALARWKMVP